MRGPTPGAPPDETVAAPRGPFRRADRLIRRADFGRTLRKGSRRRGATLTVAVAIQETSGVASADRGRSRLGLAVAKTAGNAPARARLRRLLRAAFRALRGRWPAVDLVVQSRVPWPDATLDDAIEALDRLVLAALTARTRGSPRGRDVTAAAEH